MVEGSCGRARRAEGSWAHGGGWHGRDQNWAALLGPLKPKRAHQTEAFAPLHAARARRRVKPPGHRKRCRARAKRRALRTRRDPPLTEGRSGKIPLCRRTLPGWKCHQCLALRHPPSADPTGEELGTPTHLLPGPPPGQMFHSLGKHSRSEGEPSSRTTSGANAEEAKAARFLPKQFRQLAAWPPAPDMMALGRAAPPPPCSASAEAGACPGTAHLLGGRSEHLPSGSQTSAGPMTGCCGTSE